MSRRVTFRSELKDRDLTIQALKSLNYSYNETGSNTLLITSGPMNRATINLSTGEVEGDSDYHTRGELGGLRQAYSEAEFRRITQRQGATIESREVNASNQVIRLLVRMTG
jgi:hypothetical protein